ncbi:MAG: aspartyl/asparaginyl beta-hydroxylase domain-containing protein [Gammaproteobacteria bacterium]|nr:aspartyl/asparaginyl beta-hydroxylase domain-containing protein [Gammaproteobacteria bacterium]
MRTWLDLTDRFPIRFDVERMRADLDRLTSSESWLDHYDSGLSTDFRAILLKSKGGETSGPKSQLPAWDFADFRRTVYVDRLPYFRELMDQIQCPQGRMRILRLAPGCVIGEHRDVGAEVGCLAFGQVRLHVPIITNDRVTFFVGGERIRMQAGRLYYVNFSKRHYVRNDGAEARIHLVMDLKVNDWLKQAFPPSTRWEEYEEALARATWPTYWRMRQYRVRAERQFWKHYEGSRVQALRHRVLPKHRAEP